MSMRTIAINAQNDIYTDKGNLVMAEDEIATGMVVANKIRTRKGELQLDTTQGIPYLEIFQRGNPDLRLFSYYLMSSAQKEPTVRGIKSLFFGSKNGLLSYTMELETKYGEGVTING